MAHDVARAIRETIRIRPDMDVLDFGCGTGLLTLELQPEVRSVTGVDSSQGMLDILTRKISERGLKNVKTRLMDPDRGDLLEGQFDLVVSSMTFHHIRGIRPLLGQFARILKHSGLLCVADLDPDGGTFHDDNTGVFHAGFDRCLLRRELEDAGFGSVRNRTAAIVLKPAPGGETRALTVFLLTGRKP
jgi:ubiquinone/menaquinone biosynthesis C-methylase UbiE